MYSLARVQGAQRAAVGEKAVDDWPPDAASAPVKGRKVVRQRLQMPPVSAKCLEAGEEGVGKNAVKTLRHCFARPVNQSGAVFGCLQNPCFAELSASLESSSASVPVLQHCLGKNINDDDEDDNRRSAGRLHDRACTADTHCCS